VELVHISLVGIIFLMSGLMGFSVYFADKKNPANRTFAFFASTVALWVLFDFSLYQSALADYQTLLNRLNIANIILLIFTLAYFVSVFPKEIFIIPRAIKYVVVTIVSASVLVTIFTNKVIDYAFMENYGSNFKEGPLFVPIVAIFGSILAVFSIIMLVVKYRKFSGREKEQIKFVLYGITAFLILNVIFNLLIPMMTNSFEFARFGTYSTIIFVAYIAYSIVKYQLFDLKVILTESAVIIINVISALQIITSSSISEGVLRALFFLVILGGSVLLIRSVKNEIKQRQELAIVAQTLKETNEKLKEVDKLKDDFLSMASHELNTPIAAIEGYLSMILVEKLAGELPPKAKTYLDSVYQSSIRLAHLVKDLLNVSRIESGRVHIIWDQKPLEDVINQAVMEVASKTREAKHILTFEKPKTKLPSTWFDVTRITEILINILGNAIKYTDTGGKITVKAVTDDNKIVVSVEDNGRGIPVDRQDAVFGKFMQVNTVKDQIKGTGLGMYISKKFIELMGGKIWFKSEGEGKGTTFYFSVPIVSKKPFDPHEGEGEVLH